MAKLVSFNTYDELLSLARSTGATKAITLSVLGARGSYIVFPSTEVAGFYYPAIVWVPITGALYIAGPAVDSNTSTSKSKLKEELTSSNFSTYFPSGGMLVI